MEISLFYSIEKYETSEIYHNKIYSYFCMIVQHLLYCVLYIVQYLLIRKVRYVLRKVRTRTLRVYSIYTRMTSTIIFVR